MFVSELVVKKVPNTKFAYELTEDLIWQHYLVTKEGLHKPYQVVVPSGFICDFATVPWLFQRVFPKMGTLSDKPAVLHDWLYVTEYFNRKTCDDIFLKALLERGVSKWKAYSMYYAVRVGGWYIWKKHDQERVRAIRKSLSLDSSNMN